MSLSPVGMQFPFWKTDNAVFYIETSYREITILKGHEKLYAFRYMYIYTCECILVYAATTAFNKAVYSLLRFKNALEISVYFKFILNNNEL